MAKDEVGMDVYQVKLERTVSYLCDKCVAVMSWSLQRIELPFAELVYRGGFKLETSS